MARCSNGVAVFELDCTCAYLKFSFFLPIENFNLIKSLWDRFNQQVQKMTALATMLLATAVVATPATSPVVSTPQGVIRGRFGTASTSKVRCAKLLFHIRMNIAIPILTCVVFLLPGCTVQRHSFCAAAARSWAVRTATRPCELDRRIGRFRVQA